MFGLYRLAGQRHGPIRGRADAGVGPALGPETDPCIDDLAVAAAHLGFRHGPPQQPYLRLREHSGDARHAQRVRRDHAVDLRDQARGRRQGRVVVRLAGHRASGGSGEEGFTLSTP